MVFRNPLTTLPGSAITGPINGGQLVAGSVGSTALAVGSVTTNALAATAITGKTITGGIINGTVYNGTDYIQNSAGTFFYSGTPAAGNLIASIASVAGTDGFGNAYVSGVTGYDGFGDTVQLDPSSSSILFAGLTGSDGQISAQNNASGIGLQVAALEFLAPTNAGFLNQAALFLNSGQAANGVTGAASVASAELRALGGGAVDLHLPGALVHSGETWHVPSAAAGWTIGTLVYRNDGLDNVRWKGSITYTGASVVTAAGISGVTTAVPAAYRPKVMWPALVTHWTSTNVQKNTAASVRVNTDGTLQIQWGDGVTGSAHDVNGLAVGDVFHIETSAPLGNLA